MPTIILPGPLTIFFYSRDCGEPMHVHINLEDGSCKVWIDSWEAVQVDDLKSHQVRKIVRELKRNETLIRRKWNEHCKNKAD